MSNNKNKKDSWILSAIARRYLVVNKDGTVWRAKKASINGQIDKSKGYALVAIQTHKPTGRVYFNMIWLGCTKSVLLNRVVALRFLPNPFGLEQVNHISGEKADNCVNNLEWASASENEKHAHRTGLKTGRGSSNSNARLTGQQVIEIRGSSKSAAELAVEFDVARSTINNVLGRKTWKHL